MSNTIKKRLTERYVPKNYELKHEDKNLHIYYGGSNERPIMLVFKAKGKNSIFHKYFRNTEDREKKKQELIDSHNKRSEYMAERLNKRKRPHQIKIGDIFYSSWGYDQTNVNFYQVIDTTEKTVTVQEIMGSITRRDTDMSGYTVAVKDSFIANTERGQKYEKEYAPMRKIVNMAGDRPSIKIESFEWAWLDKPGQEHSWSSWA